MVDKLKDAIATLNETAKQVEKIKNNSMDFASKMVNLPSPAYPRCQLEKVVQDGRPSSEHRPGPILLAYMDGSGKQFRARVCLDCGYLYYEIGDEEPIDGEIRA